MTCSNNYIPELNTSKCSSSYGEPIDLTVLLERMLFTEIQIKWIYDIIHEESDNGWFEIESFGAFPSNHIYGFKRNGGIKKGSKYKLRIGFIYKDENNKWTGTQRGSILLEKRN